MLVGSRHGGARHRGSPPGLLLAVGMATALHYAGVIIAAWRAIGEVGDVRSASYFGIVGGLLILAAGAWAHHTSRAE